MKKLISLILAAAMLFCLVGCSDSQVKDTRKLIDAIGQVTLDSEAAIDSARAAYDALSPEQQQQIQDEFKILRNAEYSLLEAKFNEFSKLFTAIAESIGQLNGITYDLAEYISRIWSCTDKQSCLAVAEALAGVTSADELGELFGSELAPALDAIFGEGASLDIDAALVSVAEFSDLWQAGEAMLVSIAEDIADLKARFADDYADEIAALEAFFEFSTAYASVTRDFAEVKSETGSDYSLFMKLFYSLVAEQATAAMDAISG